MSLRYRAMYRLGFKPWDDGRVPPELSRLVEGPQALPPGRALDIGCGTGTQAIYLASRGWAVTAVDAVERPLRTARQRAAQATVDVEWIQADVADLASLGAHGSVSLLHDRGCFHDLPNHVRVAYAKAARALAAPGTTLLLMSFVPTRRRGQAALRAPRSRSASASIGAWPRFNETRPLNRADRCMACRASGTNSCAAEYGMPHPVS